MREHLAGRVCGDGPYSGALRDLPGRDKRGEERHCGHARGRVPDLLVANRDLTQSRDIWGNVALNLPVVIAERHIPWHPDPGGRERPHRRVHEAGDGGVSPSGLRQVLGLSGWGPIGMPVMDVIPFGVGTLHPLPRALLAAVSDDLVRAVQDVDLPAQLVLLAAVGDVAGGDREAELQPGNRTGTDCVDRRGHGVGDLRGEHLLRAVGGVEGRIGARRVADAVGVFHPQRGLGVDDVDVGDLGEGQRTCPAVLATCLRLDAQVGTHEVRLTGRRHQRHVTALAGLAAQQGLLDGRDRLRFGGSRCRPAGVTRARGARADPAHSSHSSGGCAAFEQVASGESHGNLRNCPRLDARAAADTLARMRSGCSQRRPFPGEEPEAQKLRGRSG